MRSGDYSDKIKKECSWEEVTEAFLDENATLEQKKEMGSSFQERWKNIRDRYSREIKEKKGKSGQARKGKNT
ncbi:hypothetical protein JTB14_033267 [Gonioctena quinquepunctata]|nr:hypothetical protein JTB14_033267 [Gonioctena quinquepunctata]